MRERRWAKSCFGLVRGVVRGLLPRSGWPLLSDACGRHQSRCRLTRLLTAGSDQMGDWGWGIWASAHFIHLASAIGIIGLREV
jgi:hypothetical protein